VRGRPGVLPAEREAISPESLRVEPDDSHRVHQHESVTKRSAPALAAIEKEFMARGVNFVFVNPIASDSEADAAAAIRTHGFASPYVRDTENRISAALGARSTAEGFVLDGARTLVYRGAIDDQYGLGYSLEAPKRRYLIEVLNAVLAGKTPEVQCTTA